MASFFKLFGIEEFELSPVHSKKIVECRPQYGQGNDGQCPTNGPRRPSSVIDDSSDGPNGGQNIQYGKEGLQKNGVFISSKVRTNIGTATL